MAPQIIVIPQNLLQQSSTQSQSLLRISPQPKQFRVIASSSSNTASPVRTLMTSPVSRPVATVVGCKRPAPSLSPEFDIKDIKEEDEDEFTPVRKRANLDHLSPEERLMRRKLKNRVAAQNARDKKKAQCEDMEKLINQMSEERRKLVEENSRLQEINSKLQLDNASLQEENTELKQRLGINPVNPQLTLELPLSPLSHSPAQPTSPHSDLFGPPSPSCAQLTAEKEESLDSFELYVSPATRVNPGLRLDTTLDTELDTLLETPTTEAMLDNILAETDYIDNKWTQQLDDLFPELD